MTKGKGVEFDEGLKALHHWKDSGRGKTMMDGTIGHYSEHPRAYDLMFLEGFKESTFVQTEKIELMKNVCNCVHGKYATIGPASFECDLGDKRPEKCAGCKHWGLKIDA